MAPFRFLYCTVLCGLLLVCPISAAEPGGDEQVLKSVGFASGGPSLLEFFRKQTASEATRKRAQALIRQLGDDDFSVREKAAADLVALGPVSLPLLREALRSSDLEVGQRARECLEQIQTKFTPAVLASAVRLLANHKPAGTAEVLLAFLPGIDDDFVKEEVLATLTAVASKDGKLDPTLAASLTADSPARRAAAAITLCRVGDVAHRPAVRKLLQDADAQVRLGVATALALTGERAAVPVLIELLGELPAEQCWQAEDLLYRLAGATAPAVPNSNDPALQRKYRDAWRAWWREHEARVDMTQLQGMQRPLGYLLIVELDRHRVVELDRQGKERWHVAGLESPLDAEVLPGQRILVAEHNSRRVTERNLKGDVLWEKKLPHAPCHAQRLPNGFTFIVTSRQILEVDRTGKQERVLYSPQTNIITARRLPSGRIGCVLSGGTYVELDPSGKERKRFAVGEGVFTTNSLTVLPNNHLLVVSYGGHTIQEYDSAGTSVWKASMDRPLCAVRLPGGNTLVSSQGMVLVEFDRTGKEVSRRKADGHPCQIRYR